MSKRRGRAAVLILALLATASAAGCGKESGGDSSPRKVAFVVQNTKLNYGMEMAEGFRGGVRQVGGVEQVVVGPDLVDGPAQLAMFEELANTSIDGMAVFTAFTDLFAEPMARTTRKGVPMLTVDSKPPPASGIKLYIGGDNEQLGRLLADEVISKLPPNATGKIVIGSTTPGTPTLDQRANGMRDQIRKRLPGVTISGPFDTKRDAAINLASWGTLVKANPTALAFLGNGNLDAVSLASVRTSTGGTWQAGAFDLEPAALAGVKANQIVVVSPEHYLKGALAGRLMAQRAKTGTALPEGWLYTPGLVVNSGNIDAIMARQASAEAKDAYFAPLIEKTIRDKSALRPLTDLG